MTEIDDVMHVDFHYLKGKDFRTSFVEGVMGSITPSGRIVCVFYTERAAIPQNQKYSATKDGSLKELIDSEGKSGFVRELEIALSFDKDMAEEMIKFLSDRIKELDEDEP